MVYLNAKNMFLVMQDKSSISSALPINWYYFSCKNFLMIMPIQWLSLALCRLDWCSYCDNFLLIIEGNTQKRVDQVSWKFMRRPWVHFCDGSRIELIHVCSKIFKATKNSLFFQLYAI